MRGGSAMIPGQIAAASRRLRAWCGEAIDAAAPLQLFPPKV